MILSLGAIFFSVLSLLCAVQAKSSTGNSVLVVLQPSLKRDHFTTFFDNLESKLGISFVYKSGLPVLTIQCIPERGYELTFRSPKADKPPIIEYDIPTFSHIILFAPDTKCEKLVTHIFTGLLSFFSVFPGYHSADSSRRA